MFGQRPSRWQIIFGVTLDMIFDMERLPAPGETRLARAMRTEPGGVFMKWCGGMDGAEVALYGAVGRDSFAGPAQAGLESADVDLWGVEAVAGVTGVTSIVTDTSGRNAIAVAPGANLKARQDKIPDEFLDEKTFLLVQMECDSGETARLYLALDLVMLAISSSSRRPTNCRLRGAEVPLADRRQRAGGAGSGRAGRLPRRMPPR